MSGEAETDPHAGLSVSDRVRIAHGFTLLTWGLGLVFLLLTGALRIPALDRAVLPAYVPAMAVVFWGLRQLRVGPLSHLATPVTWRTFAPGLLMLYLAPFYAWWLRVPHQSFFVIHVLLLAAAGMWLLFEVNGVGARMGRRLGLRVLAAEADLFGIGVLSMGMAIPVFAGVIAWRSQARNTGLYAEGFTLLYHLHRAWLIPALAPLSLTMASCWRLRRAALDSL